MIKSGPPPTIRAGVYTRLSKDPHGTKPNIAGQERRCREIVDQRGWQVAEVYVDRDRTAAGRDPFRPDYARMCDDLKARRIDAIVVASQDRLVREPFELELLLRLCEDVGVDHVVTGEGEVTDQGVLHARIRASVAAEEIKNMKKRHRDKQEDIAREGRWGGGFRAFGYSPDHMSVNETEAALLRDAATRIVAGESADAVAREWNAAGTTTVTGRPWRGKSLRRILTSPAVTGLREHNGEIVADAAWPPIIERAQWEAVRHTLASRPEAKVGRPPREYLLTGGLAVCGLCGVGLRARPRGDGVRSYVCVKEVRADGSKPCGGVRCVAEPLEELAFEKVLAAVDDGALDRLLSADDDEDAAAQRAELMTQLHAAEDKLRQAEERFLEGDVSRASYVRVRDRHRAAAEDARRGLAKLERVRLPADTPRGVDELRAWWTDASLSHKRSFIHLFVERVRVEPAPHRGARFSKDRVAFDWLF